METVETTQAAFDGSTWLRILCSQTGVEQSAVPDEVMQEIRLKRSKNGVNEAYFKWFTARPIMPDVTLSNESVALFKNVLGVARTEATANLERQVQDYKASAISSMRQAQQRLEVMSDLRAQMLSAQAVGPKDLSGDIQAIINQGWWQYDEVLTNKYNLDHDQKGFVLTTPTVNMAFYNAQAGIDMNINMGKYKVTIVPRRNLVLAEAHEGNTVVDGCSHPHVNGSHICWGNAAEIVTSSMQALNFQPVLNALRTILENYNSASPYRTIEEYQLKQNPNMYEGVAVRYTNTGSRVWVRIDEISLDHEYLDESHDGEDNDTALIRLYHKVHADTGVRIPDGEYYKESDGAMQRYDEEEGYHYEWR